MHTFRECDRELHNNNANFRYHVLLCNHMTVVAWYVHALKYNIQLVNCVVSYTRGYKLIIFIIWQVVHVSSYTVVTTPLVHTFTVYTKSRYRLYMFQTSYTRHTNTKVAFTHLLTFGWIDYL